MMKELWFDMDGTLANLYSVDGWLNSLRAESTEPYRKAKGMENLSIIARYLNYLNRKGYKANIISWTSKNGSKRYNDEIARVKVKWLKTHLKTIEWNQIIITDYGTPKQSFNNSCDSILFDDEEQNRVNWNGIAYNEKDIVNILKQLVKDNK
jgi:hypothetical protein